MPYLKCQLCTAEFGYHTHVTKEEYEEAALHHLWSVHAPSDCRRLTEQYKKDKGGICGQACLAVIEGKTIQNVLDEWQKLFGGFKGWSGWKELQTYLESRGYKVKRKTKVESFTAPFYIARVQWLGNDPDRLAKPFYGWKHWSEASAYTHFIVIVNCKMFFCNEEGWFGIQSLPDYLHMATITSYLEISTEVLEAEALRTPPNPKGSGIRAGDLL